MKFKFNHLYPLISSMKEIKKNIEQFYVTYNNVMFDCILDRSCVPYELMIGSVNTNPTFTCTRYEVDTSNIDFSLLCRVLKLNFKDNHFNSFQFLKIIDNNIPSEATPYFVRPVHLIPFRTNDLTQQERKEGFIFYGWLQHEGLNNGHAQNFNKTEKLLGKDIADFCRKHDISSKWTTNPELEVEFTRPKI